MAVAAAAVMAAATAAIAPAVVVVAVVVAAASSIVTSKSPVSRLIQTNEDEICIRVCGEKKLMKIDFSLQHRQRDLSILPDKIIPYVCVRLLFKNFFNFFLFC